MTPSDDTPRRDATAVCLTGTARHRLAGSPQIIVLVRNVRGLNLT
jgi:hypothetical protein